MPSLKRGAEEATNGVSKRLKAESQIQGSFGEGLFEDETLQRHTHTYAKSEPFKHGVIPNLIDPSLLASVQGEIKSSLSFTPKETDIYKIHQSGDLANLDGLDDASLSQLPSLLNLRDALYSPAFRTYLSTITAAGPLSGRKTDMAINVYTPGCHLLCHDDVIGSRRVSYILYLTDPEHPWREEWGGTLRLYPTQSVTTSDGRTTKTPSPDHSVSIPPAFNQLSFFAVRPGESFHDVEEVYAPEEKQTAEQKQKVDEKGRIRMAISGWYHIPQEGEEGYVEGLEEQLAEKSSLVQLQGTGDELDHPRSRVQEYVGEVSMGEKGAKPEEDTETGTLLEHDLDFLLTYLAPTYLTPDTLDELAELFSEESSLRLDNFLSKKFAARVRKYVEREENTALPSTTADVETTTEWRVARPPHKHRYLYQQNAPLSPPLLPLPSPLPIPAPSTTGHSKKPATPTNPMREITDKLLPSRAFQKWLSLATGVQIKSYQDLLARRFRRGVDYTLATGLGDGVARVEIGLGLTPTSGWEGGEDDEDGEGKGEGDVEGEGEEERGGVGGHEIYMASDDTSSHPTHPTSSSSTGAVADPAIYSSGRSRSGTTGGEAEDDDDDGILMSTPPTWNKLNIVLRDQGVLKFVKYLSRSAPGDRFDC
ncbi:MAG: hypothetical protein M1838_006133, partial [Thelocarpon superellum]